MLNNPPNLDGMSDEDKEYAEQLYKSDLQTMYDKARIAEYWYILALCKTSRDMARKVCNALEKELKEEGVYDTLVSTLSKYFNG